MLPAGPGSGAAGRPRPGLAGRHRGLAALLAAGLGGARGLLYVWADCAIDAVEVALADEHWRVREMGCKVVRVRGLDPLTGEVAPLREDRNARVRAAAERALVPDYDINLISAASRSSQSPREPRRGMMDGGPAQADGMRTRLQRSS